MMCLLPAKKPASNFASKIIDSLRARLRKQAKWRIPWLRGICVRELIVSFLLATNLAGVNATSIVVASFFPFKVARIFYRDVVLA